MKTQQYLYILGEPVMGVVADRTFKKPVVISDDSEILGIKAKDWDRVLVGNMSQELAEVKARVDATTKAKAPVVTKQVKLVRIEAATAKRPVRQSANAGMMKAVASAALTQKKSGKSNSRPVAAAARKTSSRER